MKKLIKSITFLAVVLMFASLVVLNSSCRKKESPMNFTPINSANSNPESLFKTNGYKFLTFAETSSPNPFLGSLIYHMGTGIGEGENEPDLPFGDIIDAMKELHENKQTESDFAKIDQELDQALQLDTLIMQDIQNLSNQLYMTQANIITYISGMATHSYVTNVKGAVDSGRNVGLRYYTKNTKLALQGKPSITISTLQNEVVPNFINRYAQSPVDDNDMQLQISKLNDLVCPGFSTSVLKIFTDDIILHNNANAYTKIPGNALSTYKLLENYFLYILNAQFKALIVYSNAENAWETGGDSVVQYYITQGFRPMIENDFAMFLEVVDYLSINLIDYRTTSQFNTDLESFNYGIAIDHACGPFISRANLLARMIRLSIGQNPGSLFLTMSLPRNYCSSAMSFSTGLNTYPFTIDNGGMHKSQYPYTYWTGSSSAPDNKVCFYRGNGVDNISPSGDLVPIPVSFPTIPWSHLSIPSGNVSMVWVNPDDPSQTSPSYSSTFCISFGSASLYWPWGYLHFNDNANLHNAGTNFLWNSFNGSTSQCNPPVFCTTDGGGNDYPHNSFLQYFIESYNQIGYNGPLCETSHQCYVVDCRVSDVNIGNNQSDQDPKTISAFTYYYTSPPYLTQAKMHMYGGTDMVIPQNAGQRVESNRTLFDITSFSEESGVTNVQVSSGSKSYNFGFWLDNPNSTGNVHALTLNYYCQIIYNGSYTIWN